MRNRFRSFVLLSAVLTILTIFPGRFVCSEESSGPVPTPVPTPDRWQKLWLDKVEAFRKENAALDPNKKNIVFLGDSLTKAFDVKKYFPDLPVLNRGIVADSVCITPAEKIPWRGVIHRLKESLYDCNPSHLFFLIGTNDVGRSSVPFEYFLGCYKYVIREAKKKFPDIKIILVTCPPTGLKYKKHEHLNSRILIWNEMIKKCAEEENCLLLDLYSLLVGEDGMLPAEMTGDGLHFNHLGYDRWAKKVRDILKKDR